jgi:hypothetical protein
MVSISLRVLLTPRQKYEDLAAQDKVRRERELAAMA